MSAVAMQEVRNATEAVAKQMSSAFRLLFRGREDAALVIDVVVRGASQREAAAVRGLSHDAGRKRYQRALARLRAALAA